jgi:hypothetical protein
MRQVVNILAVGQAGRLQYEAVLLVASLRAQDPEFPGQVFIAEPQPGPLWPRDPRMDDPAARSLLADLGVQILPFASRDFGASYPQGNKIEALAALPDAPFLFLDSDTLITGSFAGVDFDFDRPSASMRREATWPRAVPGGPTADEVWAALYHRFGLDFQGTLDSGRGATDWQRHLYFNAGWFFHRSPARFGALYRDLAVAVRDDPLPELRGQKLTPWLDQAVLPLVITALGGGRPGPGLAGMDGAVTCHWRRLPLLYARESDRVVAVLEEVARQPSVARVLRRHPPFAAMLDGGGARVRALFDRAALPSQEQPIRRRLKQAGLWAR